MTELLDHRRGDGGLHASSNAKNHSTADEHPDTSRESVYYRPNDAKDGAGK